jgi:hypothetical protein
MATLATLVVNLTANAGGFFSEMEKAESSTSRLLGGIGQGVQTLGTVALGGLGVVAGAVTGAGVAMANLAVSAAPIKGVADSFEGLAESAGRGADDMLSALQRGSAGMIANRNLMMSFNKASQLVSTDFAVQLPEAMGYLSKVAAATGQDMGFMLDSLVTGVGRLSPMILDNLGIQVQLTEATEKAAGMFGVQASELTKTQTQAGMMAVIMEKLAANTAAMPEVAGSAAAGIAQMRAQFQNVKDQVGIALLPTLNTLLGTFGQLTGVVLPPLVSFIEGTLAPALQTGAQFISDLVTATISGQSPIEALQSGLQALGLDQIAQTIGNVATGVQNLWTTVQPYVASIAGWVGEHVQLKDVLIALGIAIASVVIPALYSIVVAVAPVIAVGLALVGIVALVRTAWENNWLGIQNIVGAVAGFITGTVWPAIQTALDFLRTSVLPPLQAAIQTLWSAATEFWTGFWSGFQPALEQMYSRLQEFWTQIQPSLMQAWQALNNLWNVVVGIWNDSLQPALERLTNALGLGGDKTSDFGEKVGALVGLLLEVNLEAILDAIVIAVNAFAVAVNGVATAMQFWKDLIDSVAAALDGLELPDWLEPGSPTALEIGIRGISEAMRDLNLGGLSLAAGGGRGGMVILAPVFLDPREYVTAGGEIDYARVGERLRELQQGI